QPGGKSILAAQTCDNPGIDDARIFRSLHRNGYFGPFVMEVIYDGNDFWFIEINPRFWGPLQLGIDCGSRFLDLFLEDYGLSVNNPSKDVVDPLGYGRSVAYSWFDGFKKEA